MIDVGDPKMARERLCHIQTAINLEYPLTGERDSAFLEKMIDQLDVHRPLGSDGKHGDRHTATCGCDPETVEQFLQKKIDRHNSEISQSRRGDGGWETADGDYSYYE